MSKAVGVDWAETAEELEGQYRRERNVERRKRLGALWRVRVGDRIPDAGRVVGVGSRTVDRWLGWYRGGGLGEVLRRVPGYGALGQPHRLSAAQQQELLAHAERGQFRTYEEARAWVERAHGVEYRPGGFYTTLHRLGVHPKVPRPVAEKADRAAQEAWRQGG
jgi:transposase